MQNKVTSAALSSPESVDTDTPVVGVHSRDGFAGEVCAVLRPFPAYEYSHVSGPHAPHRIKIDTVQPEVSGAEALPQCILRGRSGLSISVAALAKPMPYIWRNVEADELHFVQEGRLEFITGFGTLIADKGDFVCIARSVGYRVIPRTPHSLRLIVETPKQIRLAPSMPFGIFNPAEVGRPDVNKSSTQWQGGELWLKSFDGITRFRVTQDPLAIAAHLGGALPVWKLNIGSIAQQLTTGPAPCPPSQFAESASKDEIFFSLSARAVGRPPLHDNADFDELVLYHGGPGAWGAIRDPGTLTWTPKGVLHWGAEESVPEGYQAWLIECKDTLRLTQAGQRAAQAMETGRWGLL